MFSVLDVQSRNHQSGRPTVLTLRGNPPSLDSWLGMFCECNLISHASAFSIRQHPLKDVTLQAHSTIFFNRATRCRGNFFPP